MSGQNEVVAEQHAIIGNNPSDSQSTGTKHKRTTHPDAQWFPGSLGLFIHWGISSVHGTGELSWSMMLQPPGQRHATMVKHGALAVQQSFTPNDYWKQAELFNPDKYNPGKWLAAAKEAGFSYAVFTTKHHDGYTLWPSKASDFGVQKYLPGRDLVKEYIEACRANDIKVGLYYSPPDWYLEREMMSFGYGKYFDKNGKEIALGLDHEPLDKSQLRPVRDEDFVKIDTQIREHIHELLTNYGKIDILWFDGTSGNAVKLEDLRKLQPGILFNPRGTGEGDFQTPECAFPATRPENWWEYCHIWNDGAWGYLKHEIYKPTGWMLGEWAKTRSWAGNLLMNVGPDARGQLPAAAYARFAELEEVNKQLGFTLAKDVKPGPWPEKCSAPITIKGSTWYVHLVFDWDEAELIIKDVQAPKSVTLLRPNSSKINLAWSMDGSNLVIPILKSKRSVLLDVVEVDFGGK